MPSGEQVLYVANTTKQHQQYLFWAKGVNKIIDRRIRAGQQAILWQGDTNVLDKIITQLEPYGLIPAKDVPRTKPFIGCCYALDAPIDMEKLQLAFEHNNDVLTQRGYEIRKAAAIAVDGSMDEANPLYRGALELEVTEVPFPGHENTSVNESVEVVRPGQRAKPRRAA